MQSDRLLVVLVVVQIDGVRGRQPADGQERNVVYLLARARSAVAVLVISAVPRPCILDCTCEFMQKVMLTTVRKGLL